MEQERLKEGWVEFNRFYCKEGHIDGWMGDSINNPNNPTKHPMQINSIASYYRCNDGKWISKRDLSGSLVLTFLNMREEFTAAEIWKELRKPLWPSIRHLIDKH